MDAPAQTARIQTICRDLLGDTPAEPIGVRVIDSDEIGAYAWPPSTVYVTLAATQQLPNDELTAAVAHELGHLIDDGHVSPPVMLTGSNRGTNDIEIRADAIGVRLLDRAGHDRAALPRLLSRLTAQPGLSDHARERIHHRIHLLSRGHGHGHGHRHAH